MIASSHRRNRPTANRDPVSWTILVDKVAGLIYNGGMMNDETKTQLEGLQKLRDIGLQEQGHRRRSGRRYNKALLDMSDLELNQALIWYRTRIDTILAPFERD